MNLSSGISADKSADALCIIIYPLFTTTKDDFRKSCAFQKILLIVEIE